MAADNPFGTSSKSACACIPQATHDARSLPNLGTSQQNQASEGTTCFSLEESECFTSMRFEALTVGPRKKEELIIRTLMALKKAKPGKKRTLGTSGVALLKLTSLLFEVVEVFVASVHRFEATRSLHVHLQVCQVGARFSHLLWRQSQWFADFLQSHGMSSLLFGILRGMFLKFPLFRRYKTEMSMTFYALGKHLGIHHIPSHRDLFVSCDPSLLR